MPLDPKTITAVIALIVLWTAEGVIPFFPEFPGAFGRRVRHDLRNVVLGVGSALLVSLLFGGILLAVDLWAEGRGLGLLRVLELPGWVSFLLALLLFDLWMYLWHRANHRIPFLWRFHRVHHSDPALDATTGFRFHPGELFLSSVARVAVLPLLGMPLWQLAIYEAVLLPVILFHHSNVRLPRWLDYGLLPLVVTPAMHRVHHSRLQPETDSNYASLLPLWDRLFRTFRIREDASGIEPGLDEFDGEEWQSLGGILRTPLASRALLKPGEDGGRSDARDR
jgi:sterol desaturase/sphingolipid hydroxylase (fatty acid hydroxylase superfamily)